MFIGILISVCAVVLLVLVVCFYFSSIVITPKVWNYDETLKHEIDSGKIVKETFESLHKEEFFIKSAYGYNIHAIFFPNNSKKTVIFCHGYTFSLFGSVKYMNMFYNRGFNVLIYDHRHHGKSGGKNTTAGYYERYDLKTCTDWVFDRCGNDSIVGIHGESMGAATALMNAAIDDRPSFYIADCPYSDYFELLKLHLHSDYHLPSFPILYVSNYITQIRTGMSYKYASPIKTISKVNTPVLFIHGAEDMFIPNYMSKEMYNLKPGVKELWIAPNADHAEALWKNKEDYDKRIGEFLDKVKYMWKI